MDPWHDCIVLAVCVCVCVTSGCGYAYKCICVCVCVVCIKKMEEAVHPPANHQPGRPVGQPWV